MFVSCEKNEYSDLPKTKLNSITANYPNDTTRVFSTDDVVVIDTNAILTLNFTFSSKVGIEQISAFINGADADFDTAGFTKSFGSSGEYLKVDGFDLETSDNFDLVITSSEINTAKLTFQVFNGDKLYTDFNFCFNTVADSTLFK